MAELISLYRLYDDKERLLYVGISKNFSVRLSQHRKEKKWASDITHALVEFHPHEQSARKSETEIIAKEKPIHNIMRPSMGGTIIRTISIDKVTDDKLKRMKDRGTGPSGFMREAVKFYVDNGYKFPVVKNG